MPDTSTNRTTGLDFIPGTKDYRERLHQHATKNYTSRPLSAVKYLAVHHSLTKSGSAEAFARYHVKNNGWPGIGYHFVIEKSGVVKWCHDPEVKSYHVGNSNRAAIGICLTGDFREQQLEKTQLDPLIKLLKFLTRELDIDVENIWGHNQFPDYAWKQCPCIDMDTVRNLVKKKPNEPVEEDEEASLFEKYFEYQPLYNPNEFLVRPGETVFSAADRFGLFDAGGISTRNKTIWKHEHQKEATKVKVKGEPEKISDELLNFVKVLEGNNYVVFKKDTKPYNLNIVGIRSNTTTPNSFDDEIWVFWKFENNWTHKKYKVTTDPGLTYLKDPINDAGTAILKEGQYRGAYQLGKHRGKYEALVQVKPVTVIRDFDRDSTLDYDSGVEQTGLFGINIHRSSATGESTLVNRWSAGCQVFARINEYNEFMKLVKQAISNWGDAFTYSLVNKKMMT